MFSDHAEKLLDVSDVLGGQYPIFFPRNTGREAFQMYLTAATSRIFGTGISFLSLKLGTALMGLLTLPFIYLLGKEIRSKEVGLIAVFFSGIAYWPNVISRVALRFVLYPAFTAPTLYFLIRGLKKKSWNDFLAAGLFLGLGLHGYSTFRIVPLVIIAVLLVYLLQASSPKNRKMAVISLVLVGVISLIVFLPLARFAVDHYDLFSYRMQTRMSNAESPLPGDPLEIFLSNLWKALIMFQWDNGQIWVHSVTDRPALEVVSAALFSLGVLMLMVRNLRNFPIKHLVLLALALPLLVTPLGFISAGLTVLGVVVVVLFGRSDLEWVDLTGLLLAGVLLITPLNLIAGVTFLLAILLVLYQTREKWNWVEMVLLVLIPLLLLPSALSLAFPEENPSLNRSGGALIPVFLIVALALENIIVNLRSIFPGRSGKWLGYGIALLAALASLGANYRLVFVDYYQQFKTRAWNTSEIGAVIRQFSGTIGDEHQAWVVPYPHWVDTRLVGIQALGRVRDYALWPSEIASTTGAPAPKLYIYKPEDEEAIQVLQELYPDGIIERFESEVEGREFMLYYVLQ
jgi:4-amino-4-deoxy-L-arabinose transferase-like glycosyltransferase